MARSRNAFDCCESILVTTGLPGQKSKTPPSHKTRGWGTQASKPKTSTPETSTPKTSTPELQHSKPQRPNFNTQKLDSQTSKPGIRNHKEVCVELPGAAHGTLYMASTFALSSWARGSHSVDTLGWMGAYNSAHPPANTRTGVKLCPTPGNSGRAR
jgi:hypothetical protein